MNNWTDILDVNDIPKLGARAVRRGKLDIAVFRTADADVFALEDRCPHKGGPLSQGIVHGRKVTCPLHNWDIELDSGCAVAPDHGCAREFPVKLEGGGCVARPVGGFARRRLNRANRGEKTLATSIVVYGKDLKAAHRTLGQFPVSSM